MVNKKLSEEVIKEIQSFYDEGNGLTACQKKFNYSRVTLVKYLKTRSPFGSKVSNAERLEVKRFRENNYSYKKERKKQSIGYKGGRCSKCGYNRCQRSLDFHHRESKEKEMNISRSALSFNNIKNELNKCDLLCKNCHAEVHESEVRRNEDKLIGVLKWRRETKNRILASFGNECSICKYTKCSGALHIHHLDPTAKEHTVAQLLVNPRKWETIVGELRKSILVCANCHGEIHANLVDFDIKNIKRFDENFLDYKSKKRVIENNIVRYITKVTKDLCPVCNSEKSISLKHCSVACAARKRTIFDWQKYDLHKMYLTDKMTISSIARVVGCSFTMIKKKLKKLDIFIYE